MPPIDDHPLRYKMANELHARPFPSMEAPCSAAYIAIKQPNDAVSRDRQKDLDHLIMLLDRYGAPHPQPGATHYYGQIGKHWLKWEQHTEFVTYTVFRESAPKRAFDPAEFEVFPADWLEQAPGQRVTSVLIDIRERPETDAEITENLDEWFVTESLAAACVLDNSGVVAGDFRIDQNGHLRFAVFANTGTTDRRVGRIVQRLCEIETYKSMSMLGFARVRVLQPKLNTLDTQLTSLMSAMSDDKASAEDTLNDLLSISAELETLSAQSSFRFGATGAYEALVNQRIEALREERFQGRQHFAEFMMRRYAPAMRTVTSAQGRLDAMSSRSIRASNLLRTRVDVERSAQNQALLESMDQRSDLQLRLQRTVEGLSVVAISYYAVSLVGYTLYPMAQATGITKGTLTALVTLPVVAFVWWAIRRLRAKVE
ncbi:DUF3422 family protein [Roseobacter litoralis]|uniref:Membrane-anchored protein n=1 Tax=Roseobacter litoralis (strain ATCC 49566 / DSM 6996 / JCM 21268 / NBRC 15278 / OCh 149) TaxID=391595 RepID=F7ZCS9_ROSLO|nr:DUF3422 domain-containing protein [Roseobacter litoralis]AEI94503.1 hypothetical protein RLO149_c025350 [Roseobacter litoralis Och 149]